MDSSEVLSFSGRIIRGDINGGVVQRFVERFIIDNVLVELGRFDIADASANALWAACIHVALGSPGRVVIEISRWDKRAVEEDVLRQTRGRCGLGSDETKGRSENHLTELSTPVPANKETGLLQLPASTLTRIQQSY